jgi:hypothetical protein
LAIVPYTASPRSRGTPGRAPGGLLGGEQRPVHAAHAVPEEDDARRVDEGVARQRGERRAVRRELGVEAGLDRRPALAVALPGLVDAHRRPPALDGGGEDVAVLDPVERARRGCTRRCRR